MNKTTEASSKYSNLENMPTHILLDNINKEDQTVALSVKNELKSIEKLVDIVVEKMTLGGRLFYIGAGTSGRLGIVDASECPPTFGVPFNMVVGIIAGGDVAIRKAVENAEDDVEQAWKDLEAYQISNKDVLIGIAASGTTPYVIGGLKKANEIGLATGCIVCNAGSPVAAEAKYPVEVVVGPEFLTGSTRMKSGTAQKMVLNMISTTVMVRLGKVKGNKMVDMQLTNHKLVNRAVDMVKELTGVNDEAAQNLLQTYGSVRKAADHYLKKEQ